MFADLWLVHFFSFGATKINLRNLYTGTGKIVLSEIIFVNDTTGQ
jgi:hypothetical protein